MADEGKKSGAIGQIIGIIGAVLVALIAKETAPWWWNELFGSSSQSPEVATSSTPVPASSEGTSATSAACQYKDIAPIQVDIKPDKSTYTELEQIKADYTIAGTPEGSKQLLTVVEASKPETSRGVWESVGANGSVVFRSHRPGDYQVRLFINTGSGYVSVGYCPITVKPI